jgi:hypothetical protein
MINRHTFVTVSSKSQVRPKFVTSSLQFMNAGDLFYYLAYVKKLVTLQNPLYLTHGYMILVMIELWRLEAYICAHSMCVCPTRDSPIHFDTRFCILNHPN